MSKRIVYLIFVFLITIIAIWQACIIYSTGIGLGSKPVPVFSIDSNLSNLKLIDCFKAKEDLIINETILALLSNRSVNETDVFLYLKIKETIIELRLYKSIYISVEKLWQINKIENSYNLIYITELEQIAIKELNDDINKLLKSCEPDGADIQ